MEFYTFIANNYAPFYTVPIECTERDAPYVLDGLLYHESDLDPEEHYTDTHGYVELNFAAFPMFGKRFCPRIRGSTGSGSTGLIPRGIMDPSPRSCAPASGLCISTGLRPTGIGWASSSPPLRPATRRRPSPSSACWPVARVTISTGPCASWGASIRRSSSSTISPIRHSGAGCGAACSREQLHALARHVHYGKRGHADGRDFQQQMSRASCLVLILAAIIYWQILEIDSVLRHWDPAEDGIDLALLTHISPIGWDNIVLYGEYALDRSLVARYPRYGRELGVEN